MRRAMTGFLGLQHHKVKKATGLRFEKNMSSAESSDGLGLRHAGEARCNGARELDIGLVRIPSLPFGQGCNVHVFVQPVGVFLGSTIRRSHLEKVRAQNVRDVVELDVIGVLIAHGLAQ